jgi:hypothetical protein
MKLEDVPQDSHNFYEGVKRRTYALDREGHHVEADQGGWEVETDATELAWIEVKRKVDARLLEVAQGLASPLAVHLEARMSEVPLLRLQTGIAARRLRAAMLPPGYARLKPGERAALETAFRLEAGSLDELGRYDSWMEKA